MDKPFVSVITPVLNAEERISLFLKALKDQTYPPERYEILIVDNGSVDQTPELVRTHPEITLLERTDIQNPYAARNKGLSHAGGEIMALLDVNCTPVRDWLTAGVERLNDPGIDLLGGQITFTFSEEETLGEWYDSLLFVDMEDLIERGKSCAGGNLFLKRKVYETIGPFPETQRSGMDLYWTKKATNAGFNLVYDPDAKVTYPARTLKYLTKKVFRVGTGQPKVWLDHEMHPLKMIALIFYQFIPPGTRELKQKIKRRGKESMYNRFGSLWCIHYLQKVVLSLGWAKGFFNYYISNKK